MERLSLDAFKKEVGTEKKGKKNELGNLTGGILGACHTCENGMPGCEETDNHWHFSWEW